MEPSNRQNERKNRRKKQMNKAGSHEFRANHLRAATGAKPVSRTNKKTRGGGGAWLNAPDLGQNRLKGETQDKLLSKRVKLKTSFREKSGLSASQVRILPPATNNQQKRGEGIK